MAWKAACDRKLADDDLVEGVQCFEDYGGEDAIHKQRMLKNPSTGKWEVDEKHLVVKDLTWIRNDQ